MRPAAPPGRWSQLALLCLAELLAMTLWFSGSAVVPQLTAEWRLDPGTAAWVTMSVQLGFVSGALLSATLNLPDRVSPRALIGLSALAGGLSNAALALPATGPSGALALRFATGVALAGVYPPGMKVVASWFVRERGLAIGSLIGALTLGTAAPHLLNALPLFGSAGMPPWRPVVLASSGLALLAAVLAAVAVRPGPFLGQAAPFDWRFVGRALSHRPTRLANFGYLGHMWELYAMWTWAPAALLASYEAAGGGAEAARLAGFAAIASGAAGCVLAGALADRFGRSLVAGGSLAVSGCCCLLAGPLFARPALLTALCLVWGFAVVADSAQFSAAVSELTDPRYVGTALTVQTSLGFLLTLLTIRLVPSLLGHFGWQGVFAFLALGPAFGIASMLRLRALPEAARMASGNR